MREKTIDELREAVKVARAKDRRLTKISDNLCVESQEAAQEFHDAFKAYDKAHIALHRARRALANAKKRLT